MVYYRMMRRDEPNTVVPPREIKYETIDYVYSNEMPSRRIYKGQRVVWSLAKSAEAALKWEGVRGKGMYNRLAVYDFDGSEGEFYDLTCLQSWITLIHKSKNGLIINNINGKKPKSLDAIRSIIPGQRSAISMANECQEVIFIPRKKIELATVENYDNIKENNDEEKAILTSITYDNSTIEALLHQLQSYNIKRKDRLEKQLKDLKVA